jgi:hypothetical protein
VIVDSGDGLTNIVPIYEGCAIVPALRTMPLAGYELTDYLAKLLIERGYDYHTSSELDMVEKIKENLTYVALDYEEQLAQNSHLIERSYELPNGDRIELQPERFKCAEALFQPSLIGCNFAGVHEQIYRSLLPCDMDVRYTIHVWLVVRQAFLAIRDRIQKELVTLGPDCPIRVVAPSFGTQTLAS